MTQLVDKDGRVVASSKNLRGLHTWVRKYLVLSIHIWKDGPGEGKLRVVFDDNLSCSCQFASFEVLKYHVSQWRSVYGVPLTVEHKDASVVSKANPALAPDQKGR